MQLPDWLLQILERKDVYGNTARQWLLAVAVFLVALVLLRLLKSIVLRRVAKLIGRWKAEWSNVADELFQRTKWWFLLLLALYCGSLALKFPERITAIIQSVAVVALLVQAGLWVTTLFTAAISRYAKQQMATDAASATTLSALGFFGRLVLWSLVLLLALENIGVDVTALLAGLGIGGIAVALAAQNMLGDLFASLSIMFDKPFVLGDFIVAGEFMGTVEYIGLKTTRLRSLSGEQLIFSNNDLLQSRLRNYKHMAERRILFSVGVTYETDHEKLPGISTMLREIVSSHEEVRFDRAHFKQFGDSALIFEVVYYVLKPDYAVYMDIQQEINLAIFARFAELGIEFAYPTQTLFLKQEVVGPS